MSTIMKGINVVKAIEASLALEVERLKEKGTVPRILIMRVGARPDDLAYERGAIKRMAAAGIECRVLALEENIAQEEFEEQFEKANQDPMIHGILLLRPLPGQLDDEPVRMKIDPLKDVDCMSPYNIAKVFSGDGSGFAPCTAEAVMEMLDYYGIEPEGKKAVIVGRSMVVGRPLSMLLLKRHATVTICHTKTPEISKICREADILVAAAGKAGMVTADMVGEGAVVVDVGINADDAGRLCGDVDFDRAKEKASFISPVPGGVGGVTSAVLAKHVVRSAERQIQKISSLSTEESDIDI